MKVNMLKFATFGGEHIILSKGVVTNLLNMEKICKQRITFNVNDNLSTQNQEETNALCSDELKVIKLSK